jgi:DNA-directed RNA polymerase specialized sigma24 family protein
MASPDSTYWTVLREAAAGSSAAREAFAHRYEPMVRAYLAARWKGSPLVQALDDAAKERQGGGLERARPDRPGGFRAFLYGLVRNVALRFEHRRARGLSRLAPEPVAADELPAREDSISRVFDRAWARAVMREAAARQAERAETLGQAARRRVELLRLRFQEGLPIREVARLWQDDPATLHREYARAREEFKAALLDVMTSYHPDSPGQAERESADLLDLLG